MSLANWREKFKTSGPHVAVVLITVLVFTLGFGLGRLSGAKTGESPLTITNPSANSQTASVIQDSGLKAQNSEIEPLAPLTTGSGGKFVASRNGKKYYLPWCGGVNRIKPENLISFDSAEEARARGYEPAANCPGLE